MVSRELTICMGRAGTGKTRLLHQLVLARIRALHVAGVASLVLIHDTRVRVAQGWDSSAIGYLAPERARYRTCAELVADADLDGDEPRYRSFVSCIYEDDPLALFELANARRRAGGATLVVVDELDMLPPVLNRNRPDHRPAYHCLHYGRVGPVDVLATMRMPQRVDPAWLALATSVHCFCLTGDLQLDRVRASGWPEADQLVRELPTLQPFRFITVKPGGQEKTT